MAEEEPKIADLLLQKRYIDDIQFVDAIQEQIVSGKPLEDIFISMGISKEHIDEVKNTN